MSKIIIIPDVHGRTFWKISKEKINEVDRVVFLGDYLDPYPHEGISIDDAIGEFEKIIEFKKEFNDKVVLLIGNHDCHYMNLSTNIFPCSRYDLSNSNRIEKIFKENNNLFQLLYKEDKYLFSHAGVVKDWMEEMCSCKDLDTLLKNQKLAYNSLWCVSKIRGGYGNYGSCVWSDVREFENQFEGIFQIFGHTQLSKEYFGPILGHPTFACLDCRKAFILDTETKEISELL